MLMCDTTPLVALAVGSRLIASPSSPGGNADRPARDNPHPFDNGETLATLPSSLSSAL